MGENIKKFEKELDGLQQNEELKEIDEPTVAGMRLDANPVNRMPVDKTTNSYELVLKAIGYLVKAQADLTEEMGREFEELATVQHRIDNTKKKMDKKIEHIQTLTSVDVQIDKKIDLARKVIMYYEFDQN